MIWPKSRNQYRAVFEYNYYIRHYRMQVIGTRDMTSNSCGKIENYFSHYPQLLLRRLKRKKTFFHNCREYF